MLVSRVYDRPRGQVSPDQKGHCTPRPTNQRVSSASGADSKAHDRRPAPLLFQRDPGCFFMVTSLVCDVTTPTLSCSKLLQQRCGCSPTTDCKLYFLLAPEPQPSPTNGGGDGRPPRTRPVELASRRACARTAIPHSAGVRKPTLGDSSMFEVPDGTCATRHPDHWGSLTGSNIL